MILFSSFLKSWTFSRWTETCFRGFSSSNSQFIWSNCWLEKYLWNDFSPKTRFQAWQDEVSKVSVRMINYSMTLIVVYSFILTAKVPLWGKKKKRVHLHANVTVWLGCRNPPAANQSSLVFPRDDLIDGLRTKQPPQVRPHQPRSAREWCSSSCLIKLLTFKERVEQWFAHDGVGKDPRPHGATILIDWSPEARRRIFLVPSSIPVGRRNVKHSETCNPAGTPSSLRPCGWSLSSALVTNRSFAWRREC